MYQNEYAGTGTGRTAARLAGKSAKEMGFKKAVLTQELILKKEEADLKKEGLHTTQSQQASKLWEKVRFPPQHGQTPLPPPMVAAPSQASLMLNIAGSALSAYGFHKMTNPKGTGMKPIESGYSSEDAIAMGRDPAQSINIEAGGATYWDSDMPTDGGVMISSGDFDNPDYGVFDPITAGK